jgi:uncharacterized membrane protein
VSVTPVRVTPFLLAPVLVMPVLVMPVLVMPVLLALVSTMPVPTTAVLTTAWLATAVLATAVSATAVSATPSALLARSAGHRLALATMASLIVTPAAADFRICNYTKSRVGVAIGYMVNGEGWATEGWWNIPAGNCEALLRGNLAARFYYIYAVDYDRNGEWSGQTFMCTRDKEFTIKGTDDCLARGYDRTGFLEVDTGKQQTWTVQLTETGAPQPGGTFPNTQRVLPVVPRSPQSPPPPAGMLSR